MRWADVFRWAHRKNGSICTSRKSEILNKIMTSVRWMKEGGIALGINKKREGKNV